MTTTQIKITRNCFNEFSSMIDTCANIPEEDNQFDGLFTALDNAEGNRVYAVANLNGPQIRMFIYFIKKQIEYLAETTIPELNYDGNYAEAGKCRYTIKALMKLIEQCEKVINYLCPDCNTEMHTNTVVVFGGKNKHYQECATCHYATKALA
jgi:hypothetical protein